MTTKVNSRMIDGASVNVLDFGADPTGATDSTGAIQAAIDFIANEYNGEDFFSDGTNQTQFGGTVYIPKGRYSVRNTVTIPVLATLGATRHSCINILGDGISATVLDYRDAAEDTDSLTVLGGGCNLEDFQIANSQQDGVVVGDPSYFVWYMNVERVFVNKAARDGQRVHKCFRSRWADNLSYLCLGWGFAWTGGMTSTVVQNNYANTNVNGGYLVGDRDDISLSTSSVYSSFISNAADNGDYGYLLSACRAFSLAGNGSESVNLNSLYSSASDLTVNGHFSDRTGQSCVRFEGTANTLILNGLASERSITTFTPLLEIAGSSHEISIKALKTDRDTIYTGTSPDSTVSIEDRKNKIATKSVNGTDWTSIVTLEYPSGPSETYGGELTILAVTSDTVNPNNSQNACTYKLLVTKGAGGEWVTESATAGLKGDNTAAGTWPSFDFQLTNSNLLQARHTNPSSTDRNYAFTVVADGDVRVKF